MTYEQCTGFLNTPPLWKNNQFGLKQFGFPEIDLSTFTPERIPKNIRLGHQMEHVFKQLITHSQDYKILVHNLPVKNGNRTIGEIDFVLEEVVSGKLVHVELTYKFYIINTEISEPIHQLMGPNRRDMFFTKMEKIKNEQLPLLHHPEGKAALKKNDIDSVDVKHETCYKAQLFQPLNESVHIRPLNKQCLAGFWIRFDDFNSKAFNHHKFYIPYKSEWVITPHREVAWKSHFEILMEINLRMLKENSPMVWMSKNDGVFEKFFVVWW